MNEILEFETYLSISQIKFGIYLFDTKNKNNLYGKEITFEKNLKGDSFALEIKFHSIPNIIINDLNKILENYQIKIISII